MKVVAHRLQERRSLLDPRVELPHVNTREVRVMTYAKDQWTRPEKKADGTTERVRNRKWGRGKRWLAVWIDPQGDERSKAFGTVEGVRDQGGCGAAWGCDGDRPGPRGVHRSERREGSV